MMLGSVGSGIPRLGYPIFDWAGAGCMIEVMLTTAGVVCRAISLKARESWDRSSEFFVGGAKKAEAANNPKPRPKDAKILRVGETMPLVLQEACSSLIS